ncbi:hypothetical protein [Okibacterium fritillariae]|uniref:LysM domain-containing protein n=1 Tax=Okibacterium fritillariae TaxID=123320 RepID=A0A1T5KWC1_9MICO|nr:hypothetical protein [Okibacterium fritillariae]SKC68066.1 hypothetical protein SAMN06309945_2583 [Okibacterium fritillariae]
MSTTTYGAGRVAVGALAVVLLLSGCTAPAPAAGDSVTAASVDAESSTTDATPEPKPTDEFFLADYQPGDVLARAHVAAPDASVSADVSLVVADRRVLNMKVENIVNQTGRIFTISVSPDTGVQPGNCPAGMRVAAGDIPAEATSNEQPVGWWDTPSLADPRWWRTVEINDVWQGDPSTFVNCPAQVIAAAPWEWDVPELPKQIVARDGGSAAGANGTVELEGDTPARYVVADGDVLAEICARFGLTRLQLDVLNPRRDQVAGAGVAVRGETLNLQDTPDARATYYPTPRKFE